MLTDRQGLKVKCSTLCILVCFYMHFVTQVKLAACLTIMIEFSHYETYETPEIFEQEYIKYEVPQPSSKASDAVSNIAKPETNVMKNTSFHQVQLKLNTTKDEDSDIHAKGRNISANLYDIDNNEEKIKKSLLLKYLNKNIKNDSPERSGSFWNLTAGNTNIRLKDNRIFTSNREKLLTKLFHGHSHQFIKENKNEKQENHTVKHAGFQANKPRRAEHKSRSEQLNSPLSLYSKAPKRKKNNGISSGRKHMRQRRDNGGVDFVNMVANEDWAITTTAAPTNNSQTETEEDDFMVITHTDIREGQQQQMNSILKYCGITLTVVATCSLLLFCFLKEPKGCIITTATGCPCFIVCVPLFRKFYDKYLDPAKLVKDSINKYMPGVILHDDRTIEDYEISPEEVDCLVDILDEAVG